MPDPSLKDYMLEQLEPLGRVRARAMFGGFGVYCDDVFFAIIYQGTVYFKTGPATRKGYEKEGMQPFSPNPGQTLKNYYQVPAEVLEDPDLLHQWAREAIREISR